MTVSWMDPHTTNEKSRSCMECHADSRTLGLGQGTLENRAGSWHFTPATAPRKLGDKTLPRLDGFVDIHGRKLVHVSRKGLRPFNGHELKNILDAGRCIFCHGSFKDRVMKNWDRLSPPRACRFYSAP